MAVWQQMPTPLSQFGTPPVKGPGIISDQRTTTKAFIANDLRAKSAVEINDTARPSRALNVFPPGEKIPGPFSSDAIALVELEDGLQQDVGAARAVFPRRQLLR